jgi:hypothetical protein
LSQAFWEYFERRGISEELDDWVNELYLDLETPGEVGEQMTDAVHVSYVVPTGSEGASIAANTWTQVPYNLLDADTTGEVVLEGDGTVLLPEGDYLVEVKHTLACAGAYGAYMRVIDSNASVFQTGRFYPAGYVYASISAYVKSDGETPIQIQARIEYAYAYGFGRLADFGDSRSFGTAAFVKVT